MTRIFLLAVLIAGVLTSGLFAAEGPNTLDLDGRELVVRFYIKRSPEHPAKAEEKTVIIKDRMFSLNIEGAKDSTPVEIVGWGQKDEVLRRFLGKYPCSYRYREGPLFHLPLGEGELDGREVVVRLYQNRQQDPAGYTEAILRVRGGTIRFSFHDVNEPELVGVFGEDQKDTLVKKVLGRRIFGWAYKKGLQFRLPRRMAPDREADFWWTFNDALGNPIPEAPVEVYLGHERRSVFITQGKTDSSGQLKLAFCPSEGDAFLRVGPTTHHYITTHSRFVLSYPSYGRCVVEVSLDDEDRHSHDIFVPCTPPDSNGEGRCIWGTVVDPDNNAVPGLFIEATGMYAPSGDWIGRIHGQRCGVITDNQGRFRLYMPVKEYEEKIGTLIPPKSEYYVKIEPPKELGFLPFKGKIPNGQETKITLERAGYFHTFVLEDENGPITDPNQLRRIYLYVERPGKRKLSFKYNQWRNGGMFPLGTYGAAVNSPRGCTFEAIEVTEESPRQLVFRPLPARVYSGRVVHGITGEPMAGVFVTDLQANYSKANLSMLTREQWDALHSLPTTASSSDKTLSKIAEPVDWPYPFTRIVRTDANGWFELKAPPKLHVFKLVLFEQDYLSVLIENDLFSRIDEHASEIPVTKMFPAAKVVVEPLAEGYEIRRRPRPWAKWIISGGDNPPWVQDLLDSCIDDFMEGIRRDLVLRINQGPQSFYIPAGPNLQLQFWLNPRRGTAENGWGPMTIASNINLEQGQVLDLGRLEMKRALPMFVDVIDPAGKPVEGVPVTACDQYGRTTRNTDEKGAAIFSLARDSRGEFVVEYKPAEGTDDPHLREAMPFEMTSIADANTVFTMQLSDEILEALFK
jgi:hypothetical protein